MNNQSDVDVQLLLASKSPRRRQLLEQIGISYKLLLPNELENIEQLEQVLPNEVAKDYVLRVVKLKTQAAEQRRKLLLLQPNIKLPYLANTPILCADTTVSLNGEILGKPENKKQAQSMLELLSGAEHQVLTAISISINQLQLQQLISSVVIFAKLTQQQISRYVATGEPMDKAGSYAIQGIAGQFVKKINGSYSAIMGLPLYETKQLLQKIKQLNK